MAPNSDDGDGPCYAMPVGGLYWKIGCSNLS